MGNFVLDVLSLRCFIKFDLQRPLTFLVCQVSHEGASVLWNTAGEHDQGVTGWNNV